MITEITELTIGRSGNVTLELRGNSLGEGSHEIIIRMPFTINRMDSVSVVDRKVLEWAAAEIKGHLAKLGY